MPHAARPTKLICLAALALMAAGCGSIPDSGREVPAGDYPALVNVAPMLAAAEGMSAPPAAAQTDLARRAAALRARAAALRANN